MQKWERKRDIHYRQALCAVGQVELMDAWRRSFAKNGLHIAQILLTREDFGDELRSLNMRNTLFTLVDEGIVPVINENDTVSVEEIKIGDNDNLAAQSAILWSADLLILFSDVEGLYNKNPKNNPDAVLLDEVEYETDGSLSSRGQKLSLDTRGTNSLGTGGIVTKLEAARQAASYGITTLLSHGGKPRALEALSKGMQKGSLFFSTKNTTMES
jgi:glutamate 5-kinase